MQVESKVFALAVISKAGIGVDGASCLFIYLASLSGNVRLDFFVS